MDGIYDVNFRSLVMHTMQEQLVHPILALHLRDLPPASPLDSTTTTVTGHLAAAWSCAIAFTTNFNLILCPILCSV